LNNDFFDRLTRKPTQLLMAEKAKMYKDDPFVSMVDRYVRGQVTSNQLAEFIRRVLFTIIKYTPPPVRSYG
jgi:hypothetical protein